MPDRFVPPWADDFTNEANNIWAQVQGAIPPTVPPGVIPQNLPATVQDAQQVITAAVSSLPGFITAATQSIPPQPPSTAAATTAAAQSAAAAGADAMSQLEAAAVKAAQEAWPTIQNQLQKDAMAYLQSYIQQALTGNTTPQIPDITFNGQSLTKSAAKAHAWRTFLIGMAVSALMAVLSAVGSQTNLDFFTREGWIATGTIAVGTVVQTVISYLGRLQVTPPYEKKLLAAPPSVALQMKK